MASELETFQEQRRWIRGAVRKIERELNAPNSKLKLLILKADLETLVRALRQNQSATAQKLTLSTKVTQAASAYARQAQNLRNWRS